MSRYLLQLARETRTKLRPPSSFRLAPRAPVAFDEIHEERLVPPVSAVREFPQPPVSGAVESGRSNQQAAPRPVLESIPATVKPRAESPEPSRPILSQREQTVETTRRARVVQSANDLPVASQPRVSEPAAPMEERLLTPPAAAKAEAWPIAPAQARRDKEHAFVIPEVVRTWFREETDLPIATAKGEPRPAAIAPPKPAVQPVIDVSIGKIEVTIESDSPPPLRAMRPQPSRVAAPKPAPPPIAGRLARQYMDR